MNDAPDADENALLARTLAINTASQLGPLLARLDHVSDAEEGRALVEALERTAKLAGREDILAAVRARKDYRRWTEEQRAVNAVNALRLAIEEDCALDVRTALAQFAAPISTAERTRYAIEAIHAASMFAFGELTGHGAEPLDVCANDFAYTRALCESPECDRGMISYCLELLAVAARPQGRVPSGDALRIIIELQKGAIKDQNYVVADELNTCSSVLLDAAAVAVAERQKGALPPKPPKVSDDDDEDVPGGLREASPPLPPAKRSRVSDDNDMPGEEPESLEISYKGHSYAIPPGDSRAGVRRYHIEITADCFLRTTRYSLNYDDVCEVFKSELDRRRLAMPRATRVLGSALRIVFGKNVVSRGKGVRYALEPRRT